MTDSTAPDAAVPPAPPSASARPWPRHIPVLIAGGGPVGLALAALLARYGIATLVVEADDGYCAGSRAICMSRRSLEILGWVGADELVLRRLLPLAHAGLEAFGLSSRAQDRYLGIIEQRSLSRQTGAAWQRAQVARREAAGADRRTALTEMMRDYVRNMAGGRPVHEWEA